MFCAQHDVGRAADFWVDGYDGVNDGEPLFCDIKNSGLVDIDYEVIQNCNGLTSA